MDNFLSKYNISNNDDQNDIASQFIPTPLLHKKMNFDSNNGNGNGINGNGNKRKNNAKQNRKQYLLDDSIIDTSSNNNSKNNTKNNNGLNFDKRATKRSRSSSPPRNSTTSDDVDFNWNGYSGNANMNKYDFNNDLNVGARNIGASNISPIPFAGVTQQQHTQRARINGKNIDPRTIPTPLLNQYKRKSIK